MPRITTPDDLGQLNKALQKIDKLEKRLLTIQSQVLEVQKKVAISDALHAPNPTTNDLTFTWTGATGTISWGQGSILDKNAKAIVNVPGVDHTTPVLTGSIAGLTANTYYWLGWSRTQQRMVALQDAHPILNRNDMVVICRVFTGTGAQNGTIGGGGSQATRDLSGGQYKLL